VHLSAAVEAPLQPENLLMEFNNGLIAGLERSVVREKYPFVEGLPIHAAVYEQESMLQFRFRGEHALSKILSQSAPDDTVAVVTHGGMINQLYRIQHSNQQIYCQRLELLLKLLYRYNRIHQPLLLLHFHQELLLHLLHVFLFHN